MVSRAHTHVGDESFLLLRQASDGRVRLFYHGVYRHVDDYEKIGADHKDLPVVDGLPVYGWCDAFEVSVSEICDVKPDKLLHPGIFYSFKREVGRWTLEAISKAPGVAASYRSDEERLRAESASLEEGAELVNLARHHICKH